MHACTGSVEAAAVAGGQRRSVATAVPRPACSALQRLVLPIAAASSAASCEVHGGRSGSPCRQPHLRPQRTSFCISSRDPGAA